MGIYIERILTEKEYRAVRDYETLTESEKIKNSPERIEAIKKIMEKIDSETEEMKQMAKRALKINEKKETLRKEKENEFVTKYNIFKRI